MAHFYCGTQGIDYECKWCFECINYRPVEDMDDGTCNCPILEAHYLWNGDKEVRKVLDLLIPEDGQFPGRCSMYVNKNKPELFETQAEAQTKLKRWNEAMGERTDNGIR